MGTEMSPFCETLPKKKRHKEIQRAVGKVLANIEVGKVFSGYTDFPRWCAEAEPLCKAVDGETLRRYLRYFRQRKLANIVCIDKQNGLYKKLSKEEKE